MPEHTPAEEPADVTAAGQATVDETPADKAAEEVSSDEAVSESGGSMRRLGSPAELAGTDLTSGRTRQPVDLLEAYREPLTSAGELRKPGLPPYRSPGDTMLSCLGASIAVARVVHDGPEGLVLWQPAGTEITRLARVDGREVRSLPPEERLIGPFCRVRDTWKTYGILVAVPSGAPWSVWFFWDEDGTFGGWYVNLEVPHLRSSDDAPGLPSTHGRDLVLDLWVEPVPGTTQPGVVWLKDFDELAGTVAAGRFTPEQVDAVWTIAQQAIDELIRPGAWPLEAGYETWTPPPGWAEPLTLPDDPRVRESLGEE